MFLEKKQPQGGRDTQGAAPCIGRFFVIADFLSVSDVGKSSEVCLRPRQVGFS